MRPPRDDAVPRWISGGILLVLGGFVVPVVAMMLVGPDAGSWASAADMPWLGTVVASVVLIVGLGIGAALMVWAGRIIDGPRRRP